MTWFASRLCRARERCRGRSKACAFGPKLAQKFAGSDEFTCCVGGTLTNNPAAHRLDGVPPFCGRGVD
jgi:hypothetical protein